MNHPSTPASTRRQFALSLCVFALVVALCELVQEPMPTAPDGAWSFLFAPLWGTVSDRWGRRPVLLMGLTGFAASVALFALVESLPLLNFHGKDRHGPTPDPNAVFLYDASQLENGMIAE